MQSNQINILYATEEGNELEFGQNTKKRKHSYPSARRDSNPNREKLKLLTFEEIHTKIKDYDRDYHNRNNSIEQAVRDIFELDYTAFKGYLKTYYNIKCSDLRKLSTDEAKNRPDYKKNHAALNVCKRPAKKRNIGLESNAINLDEGTSPFTALPTPVTTIPSFITPSSSIDLTNLTFETIKNVIPNLLSAGDSIESIFDDLISEENNLANQKLVFPAINFGQEHTLESYFQQESSNLENSYPQPTISTIKQTNSDHYAIYRNHSLKELHELVLLTRKFPFAKVSYDNEEELNAYLKDTYNTSLEELKNIYPEAAGYKYGENYTKNGYLLLASPQPSGRQVPQPPTSLIANSFGVFSSPQQGSINLQASSRKKGLKLLEQYTPKELYDLLKVHRSVEELGKIIKYSGRAIRDHLLNKYNVKAAQLLNAKSEEEVKVLFGDKYFRTWTDSKIQQPQQKKL